MTENIEISTNETNIGKSKFTNDDLKEMQAMTLDQKIALSLTKIAEFNNKFALKTYILIYDFISFFKNIWLTRIKFTIYTLYYIIIVRYYHCSFQSLNK